MPHNMIMLYFHLPFFRVSNALFLYSTLVLSFCINVVVTPVRHQASIWTKAAMWSIRPQGTNCSEILFKIQKLLFKESFVCEMAAILSGPQGIKTSVWHYIILNNILIPCLLLGLSGGYEWDTVTFSCFLFFFVLFQYLPQTSVPQTTRIL